MTKIRLEAQKIINRIVAVDYLDTNHRKDKIQEAFDAHLRALKLPIRPVVFFGDFKYGASAARDAARGAARGAALDAAWGAAWDAALGAARDASRDAAWGAARGAARDAAWDAAWGAARDAARDAAWDASRDAARGAARAAARDAAWGAALDAAIENSIYEHPKYKEFKAVWMPFTEAFEAGLFIYWIMPKNIIAVLRPVIRIKDNRLHADGSPAIEWPNEKYYFLNGVKVPEYLAMTPEGKLDIEFFKKEKNADVKAEFIRKYGIERMQSLGKKICDSHNHPNEWFLILAWLRKVSEK